MPPSSTPSQRRHSTPVSPTTLINWTSTTLWKPSRSVDRFALGSLQVSLERRVSLPFDLINLSTISVSEQRFASFSVSAVIKYTSYCMTLTVTPLSVVHRCSPVVSQIGGCAYILASCAPLLCVSVCEVVLCQWSYTAFS